jgi:hypothetical protein
LTEIWQGNDTPASIRIRENQRRSRNQRKELIQDLQRRVQEYELKGIAATQDMQRAARKVAEENSRLRSLLVSHGVAHEEVEAYLRSFDVASAQNHPSFGTPTSYASPVSRHNGTPEVEPAPMRYTTQLQPQPQVPVQPSVTALRQPRTSQPSCPPQVRVYAQPSVQACCPAQTCQSTHQYQAPEHEDVNISMQTSPEFSLPAEPIVPEYSRPAGSCSQSHYQTEDCNDGQITYPTPQDDSTQVFPIVYVEEDVDCPNTSSCFCPPTTAVKERPLDTGLLISCETAATIIAEMRGDGDKHRIRASLGCHGNKECNVKNSIVLELMSER